VSATKKQPPQQETYSRQKQNRQQYQSDYWFLKVQRATKYSRGTIPPLYVLHLNCQTGRHKTDSNTNLIADSLRYTGPQSTMHFSTSSHETVQRVRWGLLDTDAVLTLGKGKMAPLWNIVAPRPRKSYLYPMTSCLLDIHSIDILSVSCTPRLEMGVREAKTSPDPQIGHCLPTPSRPHWPFSPGTGWPAGLSPTLSSSCLYSCLFPGCCFHIS
jgi:hypothetical protein